jgi:Domain of unknown function (DUF1877)
MGPGQHATMSMMLRLAAVTDADVAGLGPAPEYDGLMALLEGETAVDLDKMWDAVQSLFDDHPNPLFDGAPVTEDLGFGPAMYVDPPQVRQIAEVIGGLTSVVLADRFSPSDLLARDAYPSIWDRETIMAAVKRDTVALAEAVIRLYSLAAAEDKGILVAML